ncbi:hypothetical protein NQ318_005917 [Aromia moschata]|uniref:Uncharacterized protein n=1 Tax=Aromia moschata TaxID=1265417 RepID=A0AAV8XI36_9CUCU|nr:hypothetical protein NQ318_005917 [Aromia moschata]
MMGPVQLSGAILVSSLSIPRLISVCDDYSLPVDHLAKRRPNSIAVPNPHCNNFSEWNLSSPNDEKVEVLDTYSTPRDSRQHLSQEENEPKCFTSPDREYSQPYTTGKNAKTGDINKRILGTYPDEDFQFSESAPTAKPNILDLNSPDSINEDLLPPVLNVLSPNKIDLNAKRHPSPYYYGDLYHYKTADNSPPTTNRRFRKSSSLENPNDLKEKTLRSRPQIKYKSSSVETQSTDSRDAANGTLMPPNPVNVAAYDDYGLDDMTRQRHVYETAFDCRISKSDDDLDQIDKVVRDSCPKPSQEDNKSVLVLAEDIQNMHLTAAEENNSASSGALPLRGYTPSPPSTAPLPTKFHGKETTMNSIRSAPNLPSHPKSRLKDLHLPVKSLRGRSPTTSSDSLQIHQGSAFEIEFGSNSNQLISEFKGRPGHSKDHIPAEKGRIFEIKSRPRKDLLLLNKRSKDSLLEFKGRRIRHKYSSTESMTTSSSGGSMESIKSSTTHTVPIPGSDIGQVLSGTHIRNVGQQEQQLPEVLTIKEEVAPAPENLKIKRRLPQNKNLLNLGFHTTNPEIQGSDSGISIHPRIKSRFGSPLANYQRPLVSRDFSDLPFDMPS